MTDKQYIYAIVRLTVESKDPQACVSRQVVNDAEKGILMALQRQHDEGFDHTDDEANETVFSEGYVVITDGSYSPIFLFDNESGVE